MESPPQFYRHYGSAASTGEVGKKKRIPQGRRGREEAFRGWGDRTFGKVTSMKYLKEVVGGDGEHRRPSRCPG